MHPISARSIFTDSNNSGISVDNIGRTEKKRETFFYRVSTREFLPLLFPFVSRILGLFDSIRERERETEREIEYEEDRGGKVSYLGEFSTDKEISCLVVDDPKIGSDVFLGRDVEGGHNPRGAATCSPSPSSSSW